MKLFNRKPDKIQEAVDRAIKAGFMRGFNAARNNRLTASFQSQLYTLDKLLKTDLGELKGKARNLSINNDYARRFVILLKNNVVGPDGFTLQCNIKDPSGKPDDQANRKIEENWLEWGKKQNASVTGRHGFVDLCMLFISSLAIDGEFLARRVKGFNNPWRYAIQPLETDLLDITLNKTLGNGNEIRMGIEFDPWDRPVRYYLRKRKSIDSYYMNDWDIFPADEILHSFIQERPFQSRGIPPMCAAMIAMHNMAAAEEAEIIAMRAEASKMGFYVPNPEAVEFTADEKDDEGNFIENSEPGTWEIVPKGYKIETYDPTHPNGNFGIFKKEALKSMVSGLWVGYHSFANDLENVNYSSIRQGALDERDSYKVLQSMMIADFCEPVFSDLLEMSLLTQKVTLPFSKLDKFNKPVFYGRRWGWVDPAKDIAAVKDELALKINSRSAVCAERGLDFKDIIDKIAEEEAYAKSKGVSLEVIDSKITALPEDDDAKKNN